MPKRPLLPIGTEYEHNAPPSEVDSTHVWTVVTYRVVGHRGDLEILEAVKWRELRPKRVYLNFGDMDICGNWIVRADWDGALASPSYWQKHAELFPQKL